MSFHLIPEPAGDWQDGDRQMWSSPINQYRARPVKAQAGQLWRDKIIQEFADYLPIRLGGLPDSDVAEVTKIAAEVLADVLAVSAQACACEAQEWTPDSMANMVAGQDFSVQHQWQTFAYAHNATVAALRRELADATYHWKTWEGACHDAFEDQHTLAADRDQWRNTAKGWETEVKMWAARCARAANGRGSSGLR